MALLVRFIVATKLVRDRRMMNGPNYEWADSGTFDDVTDVVIFLDYLLSFCIFSMYVFEVSDFAVFGK